MKNFIVEASYCPDRQLQPPSKDNPDGPAISGMSRTIYLAMRITAVLLLIGALQVSATGLGQKVSFSGKNVPLSKVFMAIEEQTGLGIISSHDLLEKTRPVTLSVKGGSIDEILQICFAGQPMKISYTRDKYTITILADEQAAPAIPGAVLTANDLHGRITDSLGNPIAGATVTVKSNKMMAVTDAEGKFTLHGIPEKASLVITSIGYETREYRLRGEQELKIILKVESKRLENVEVYSTGYQRVPKERATGSFAEVNNELLNRRVSTDVLSRLNGVTTGVLFDANVNKSAAASGGQPIVSIRGRSTLFANTDPLIVLDNFPYEGDVNNINPNDIESVTILKDAAAASIWGVRAGNGVIVLTSKRGKLNQAPKISLNSNVSISGKPDLFAVPQLTSSQFIDMEKFAFDHGQYDVFLRFIPYYKQSPVIDLLEKMRNNPEDKAALTEQLNALRKVDVRDDLKKYFYRNTVNQQHAINIQGGSTNDQYYFSAGYDKNIGSGIPTQNDRLTLNARNTYQLLNQRLELRTDILYSRSRSWSQYGAYSPNYPYEQPADANGNALPVYADWRQSYKDAFANSGLPDWNYYPLRERNNKTWLNDASDYLLNIGLSYKIIPGILTISADYRFQSNNGSTVADLDTTNYYARNLINSYSQTDASGTIIYPIPVGDMVNTTFTTSRNNVLRAQLNFSKKFQDIHEISFLAGAERKDYNTTRNTTQIYGYYPDNASNITVDYLTSFTQRIGGSSATIPNGAGQGGTTDRMVSYFGNLGYTFLHRYTLSASARKDESNLFGVNANQKGVPLYSMGLAWELSKEAFYRFSSLPYIRLRITNGYNGNLTKNLSAYTTAEARGAQEYYRSLMQAVINPPNPSLSWEKVHMINAGIDFGSRNNRITGSLDIYSKEGENLIGNSPVAPQTGFTQFTGNVANILTKGVEFSLRSVNLKGPLTWSTSFLFSWTRDKVTAYKMPLGANSTYVDALSSNPLVGKPWSGILAYPWMGLDSSGNPRGYLDGKISEDYAGIQNSTNLKELAFIGTSIPTFFGSLLNAFSYKGIGLSFNISWKFGYYFRRATYNSSLFQNYRQPDYDLRWQKPGDERITNVPAIIYPFDGSRDNFVRGSTSLVERGDHIRLKDIQASYTFGRMRKGAWFSALKFYAYADNLGLLLWRANKRGLDPDYVHNGSYSIPDPRIYSIGFNAVF